MSLRPSFASSSSFGSCVSAAGSNDRVVPLGRGSGVSVDDRLPSPREICQASTQNVATIEPLPDKTEVDAPADEFVHHGVLNDGMRLATAICKAHFRRQDVFDS